MGRKKRITQVEYVITLGDGKDYTVKPLSLGETKAMMSTLNGIDKISADTDLEKVPGLLDKLIEVCSVILKRGNPTITLKKVSDIVSVNDIKSILGVGLGGDIDVNDTEEI